MAPVPRSAVVRSNQLERALLIETVRFDGYAAIKGRLDHVARPPVHFLTWGEERDDAFCAPDHVEVPKKDPSSPEDGRFPSTNDVTKTGGDFGHEEFDWTGRETGGSAPHGDDFSRRFNGNGGNNCSNHCRSQP